MSSFEHRLAVPSLLVNECKSVAHSDLKICLSNDNLDLSGVISTKQFLPCSFFPPPFLQEESSLGQASKEWCNLAQQSEVGIFCPFVVTASFCYLYVCAEWLLPYLLVVSETA